MKNAIFKAEQFTIVIPSITTLERANPQKLIIWHCGGSNTTNEGSIRELDAFQEQLEKAINNFYGGKNETG